MAGLSSALRHIAVSPSSPPRYHTLHLRYPALNLLPEGTPPYLYPPQDILYRERPELGTYHLEANDLAFFHRFRISSSTDTKERKHRTSTSTNPLLTKLEAISTQLSDLDLARLSPQTTTSDSHPWLSLLHNLLHRVSDRAYLHVQQQLNTQAPLLAQQDENLHASQWDTVAVPAGHEGCVACTWELQSGDGEVLTVTWVG